MAEPIKYYPDAGVTSQTPQEALEQLLTTLHRSGTLRALDGFFGRFADISEVAVEQLNGPRGRNLLGNLAVLATARADSTPVALERVTTGIANALGALQDASTRRAPGVFKVLLLLRHRDTRRGLYAIARVLQEIGRQLTPEAERSFERRRTELAAHAPQPPAALP